MINEPELEPVKFGTSGLRGPASGFTPVLVAAYVTAFLDTACSASAHKQIAIGGDLRASSDTITGFVAAAAAQWGWEPIYCGTLPTPALAAYAIKQGIPAIMITGSHIPPQYNGLKFYRPEGELLKADEEPIMVLAGTRLNKDFDLQPIKGDPIDQAAAQYCARYVESFAATALTGLRIGIFTHSAAGRDLIPQILEALGASCHVFGHSDEFIAIDTEALEEDHMRLMRNMVVAQGFDAVVSTDGDGDRPLLLDEQGKQINGDVLGALTARALGANTVVTPLTSTSAVEASGWFDKVVRTKIGSPYVVSAMAEGAGEKIVGFEANGGFLVQTPFRLAEGELQPLPTRDAMLPIIAVLAECVKRRLCVSALASQLPERVMKADRLKSISPQRGNAFVSEMAQSREKRAAFDRALADPHAIDITDGTRLALSNGMIVHFRQSGNAPELRCYVEADTEGASAEKLSAMMQVLADYFSKEDAGNAQ